MLLNEIKKIFETDRDALASAVRDLNINTDIDTPSGGRDRKPGDVPASLKNVLERSIITVDYVGADKSEVEALTGTAKAKADTIAGLGFLSGNIGTLETLFTAALHKLDSQIGDNLGKPLNEFIQSTQANLHRGAAGGIADDYYKKTKDTLQAKRDALATILMKGTNSQTYVNNTIAQIENFLKSPNWKNTDGSIASGEGKGPTELRDRILQFYAVISKLQKNTENLTEQMDAAKAKDAPELKA